MLRSQRLLVLWTPRYFSRLWCTLELATFLKDPGNRRRIHFMPLKATGVLVMRSIFWNILAICYGFVKISLEEASATRDLTVPAPCCLWFSTWVWTWSMT